MAVMRCSACGTECQGQTSCGKCGGMKWEIDVDEEEDTEITTSPVVRLQWACVECCLALVGKKYEQKSVGAFGPSTCDICEKRGMLQEFHCALEVPRKAVIERLRVLREERRRLGNHDDVVAAMDEIT